MAINIHIRDGAIEATFRGNITAEDFQQMSETLRDLESRLEVTPDRISDLSDASFSELSSSTNNAGDVGGKRFASQAGCYCHGEAARLHGQ
jgi:hypothetical protein